MAHYSLISKIEIKMQKKGWGRREEETPSSKILLESNCLQGILNNVY